MILTGARHGRAWSTASRTSAAAPCRCWAVAALLGGGAALLGVYAWHAAAHAARDPRPEAVPDPTFFASVVGGAFMRMGMGATPFLLALLLQVAFGLSPLQAGTDDLRQRRRRPGDEDQRAADPGPVRLQATR